MKNKQKIRTMDANVLIKEVMTDTVITVHPDDTMDRVQRIFEQNTIHHLPVVSPTGKVVGMVSKSDYLKLLHGFTLFKAQKSAEYNKAILRSLLVEEVMTKQVATLTAEDSLLMAAGYFRENLFHAIPIVDDDHNLVGILSTYDLISYAFRDARLEV